MLWINKIVLKIVKNTTQLFESLHKINDLVLKDNKQINRSDDQKTTEDNNKSKDKQNLIISSINDKSNQNQITVATNGQKVDNFYSTDDMIDYYLSLAVWVSEDYSLHDIDGSD